MKAVFRRRFHSLESKKVATARAQNPQGTKANMRSSWADSIAGDEYLPAFNRPVSDIHSYEKKLGSGVSYGKSMHAEFVSSAKLKQATSHNNYGDKLSACARRSLGPTKKCVAAKESQYVDKKSEATIASAFSVAKQPEKKCAHVTDIIPHIQENKTVSATKENIIEPTEELIVQERDVSVSVEFFSTPEQQAMDSSFYSPIEPSIDIVDDAASGLSMLAQEVKQDGTASNVKGQRSNIFQSECTIHDKVCKLIIDGGSFTNAISSDLVHALSLSMRRLPMPRYIQWMNQSDTLKITHKV